VPTAKSVFKAQADAPKVAQPHRRNRSGLILFYTYTLGGMAPAVLRHGNRNFVWAGCAVFAALTWAVILGQWGRVDAVLASGRLPFHVWFVGLFVVTLLGVTAWSRAVLHAGRDASFFPSQLPGWLRAAKVQGICSALIPGFGFLVAGRAQRAAIAAWNFAILALSTLILWKSAWLWETHQVSTSPGFASPTLEKIFVACMISTAVGCLGGIVSAYEGVRLTNRLPMRASMQGSWWAVAILVLGFAFLLSFDPAARATDLDRLANSMRRDGYAFIPLYVELSALRLDPSNLTYQMAAADLYDDLEDPGRAAALRDNVQRRWELYSQYIQPEPVDEPQTQNIPDATQMWQPTGVIDLILPPQ
jgi:hypothetical protein